jgi:hypothetical protein
MLQEEFGHLCSLLLLIAAKLLTALNTAPALWTWALSCAAHWCCGSHSLGLVYSFLRKAGLDEGEARAEFEQFLSGTLSERMLDTATRWIQAERG